jgi:hypothetical protein
LKKKKNHAMTEVLVKWKGLGAEEASWVEYSILVNEFPNLVDKVIWGGQCYVHNDISPELGYGCIKTPVFIAYYLI